MSAKPPKKRGGQTKNKNAQKHGFYSELYTQADLKRAVGATVEDEQLAARTVIFKLLSDLQGKRAFDEIDLKKVDIMLRAMITVNTIERTTILAKGHGGDIATTIMDAIMSLNPFEEL
jgi:hypothetical protein